MLIPSIHRDDPVALLMCAVLNQALRDIEQNFSPKAIARLREGCVNPQPNTSPRTVECRKFKLEEAEQERADIISWVGSEDFRKVCDWAQLPHEKVEDVFINIIGRQEGA